MSTGTMDTLLFQSDHASLADGPLADLRAEAFARFSRAGLADNAKRSLAIYEPQATDRHRHGHRACGGN